MVNNEKKNMTQEDQTQLLTDLERENVELRIDIQKASTQARIATLALVSLVALNGYLVWADISIEKLEALNGSLDTYNIALASIVGAYMGFTAWLAKGK